METYEYGIPPIYADSEVLDFDALQSQTAEPGVHYPARAKPGQSLAAGSRRKCLRIWRNMRRI